MILAQKYICRQKPTQLNTFFSKSGTETDGYAFAKKDMREGREEKKSKNILHPYFLDPSYNRVEAATPV